MTENLQENTYVTESICVNCKGKGTSFGIKLKAWLKGAGTAASGALLMALADGAFIGKFGVVMLLVGCVQIMMTPIAKCTVCKGTGKVNLTVEKH